MKNDKKTNIGKGRKMKDYPRLDRVGNRDIKTELNISIRRTRQINTRKPPVQM